MKHGSVVQGKVQVGKGEVAMWKIRVCSFRGGGRSLKLVRGQRKRSLLCDEVMRLEGRAAPLGCAVFCKYFNESPENILGGDTYMYVARKLPE